MKKLLLLTLVILSLLTNSAMAQSSRLDSLQKELVTADSNETRARILFRIGTSINFENLDSAIFYMRQVPKISTSNRLKADALEKLSAYYRLVRPDSTFYYGNLAFQIIRENGFDDLRTDILSSLAFTEHAIGNMAQAIQFALQAVKAAEENDQTSKIGFAKSVLAMVHISNGSFNKAIEIQREALNHIKSDDFGSRSVHFAFIALCYAHLNQLDSAIYYSKKAIDLSPKVSSQFYFLDDLLGDIYHQLDDIEKSLFYYHKALRSTELYITFNSSLAIAEIYNAQNNLDSALFYGRQAIDIAMLSGFFSNIIRANVFLSSVYETSDPYLGIKYSKEALAYKDSLTAMERSMAIDDFESMDKSERQRELEDEIQASQTRLKMNTLLGSSFTLLVVAFLLYRSRRAKQRSKEKIESAFDQLKSTQTQLIQSEKMASLGELTAGIAHEIQNPLNFVNNFSEVNDELIEELREAVANNDQEEIQAILDDLKENEQKIKHHGQRAEGIVKGMLMHSRTSHGEKEPTDINALADEYLRLAFHGMRAKDKSFNADFKTDFDEALPKINVVPQDIGRVLLNLINNAFQAAAEVEKSEVVVSTKKLDSQIEIKVSDNGLGIPEEIKDKIFQPFFTTKPTGSGTGLGLSLSYDIVKAHGGEIKVNSKDHEGSEFTITMPVL